MVVDDGSAERLQEAANDVAASWPKYGQKAQITPSVCVGAASLALFV
jgi:hypothetical protein